MNNLIWMTATAIVGVNVFATPIHANALRPVPRRVPSMAAVVVFGPERDAVMNRLVENIEHSMQPENNGITTIEDVLQSPALDGLLDERGDVNLPLGLTVYDAMGATSVGFGTKF